MDPAGFNSQYYPYVPVAQSSGIEKWSHAHQLQRFPRKTCEFVQTRYRPKGKLIKNDQNCTRFNRKTMYSFDRSCRSCVVDENAFAQSQLQIRQKSLKLDENLFRCTCFVVLNSRLIGPISQCHRPVETWSHLGLDHITQPYCLFDGPSCIVDWYNYINFNSLVDIVIIWSCFAFLRLVAPRRGPAPSDSSYYGPVTLWNWTNYTRIYYYKAHAPEEVFIEFEPFLLNLRLICANAILSTTLHNRSKLCMVLLMNFWRACLLDNIAFAQICKFFSEILQLLHTVSFLNTVAMCYR
jgi:hypothetical protein